MCTSSFEAQEPSAKRASTGGEENFVVEEVLTDILDEVSLEEGDAAKEGDVAEEEVGRSRRKRYRPR